MRNFYKNLSIIIISFFWFGNQPAVSGTASGTAGFEFLRTEVGARASAMGGAFVAVAGDLNNLFYNPGGLAEIRTRGGSVSYLKHLLDFHSGHVVTAFPTNWGTVGVGINYLNFGEFKRTTREDPEGTAGETFGANSFALVVGTGSNFRKIISFGANLKYIRSSIDNLASDAFALDFGILAKIPLPNQDFFNFGVSVGNVGQVRQAFISTKDDLPMVIRAGFSKKLAHLPLFFSAQVYKYKDVDLMWALGGEFIISSRTFFRLGYNSIGMDQHIGTSKDRFAGANVGFGIIWRKYRFDYTLSSIGEVGTLNRIAVTGAF